MKRFRLFTYAAVVLCLSLFVACSPLSAQGDSTNTGDVTESTEAVKSGVIDFKYTERELDGSYNEAGATSITLKGDTADVNGTGASASGGIVTVSDEGTYILNGTLNDGQIIVDAEDTDKVQLVFKGVYIYSSVSAPVYVKSADKVFLTLAEGTENTIEDSNSYALDDNSEPSGAIFSKSDLTVNGSGTLTVNANFDNGIHSKDDLTITGGVITVTSVNDGLKGRDRVAICKGDIQVYSEGDGICSNNDEDPTLGFVSIDGGNVLIKSALDAVQAETVLQVTGGSLSVVSGGGAENAVKKTSEGFFGGFNTETEATETTDEVSMKGLKASSGIYLLGGTVTADSSDDAIHSNGDISIFDGSVTLSTGDDGIHADGTVDISGGTILITESLEGIEGANIEVSGGGITLTASDDGFNASNGNSQPIFEGAQTSGTSAVVECNIKISGGNVYVNAAGDGIDSNGLFSMSGGTVYVDGPENDGNGALDYVTSSISGGTLVAAGSAGMAQNMASENQCSLLFVFSDQKAAGTEILLADENANTLVSYTPTKAFKSVVISSPKMEKGKTYSIICGKTTTASVSMTEASLSISESGEAVNSFGSGFGGGRNDNDFVPPQDGGEFRKAPFVDFGERPSRGEKTTE